MWKYTEQRKLLMNWQLPLVKDSILNFGSKLLKLALCLISDVVRCVKPLDNKFIYFADCIYYYFH